MVLNPWILIRSFVLRGMTIAVMLSVTSCRFLPSFPGANPTSDPATSAAKQAKPCNASNPGKTSFDPVSLTHAKGFRIEYHDRYKVVTVSTPWANAQQSFQYLLVQCGTPIPEGFDQAQIVTIPVEKVVVLSTTHIPFFDRLNALDTIKGIRQVQEVSNPTLRQKFDRSEVKAVGNGTDLNFESIVSLKPDLVTTFGIANVETSSIQRLQELGLSTAVIAEYLEADPLAQAEWIKFIAAFLNQEKQADIVFNTIVQEYNQLRSLTQDLDKKSDKNSNKNLNPNQASKKRPTVLTGFNLNGTWYVAGGKSFIAQFIQDAGGTYLWQDNTITGNFALNFEAVFLKGVKADFWINTNTNWTSQAQIIQEDDRYGQFKAVQTGNIFNNDAQLNPDGGNDYWESGILNPQIVLADLIKIIHPELLPDHTLFYYHKLPPTTPSDREISPP